jgi:hypothetical protein
MKVESEEYGYRNKAAAVMRKTRAKLRGLLY